VLVTGAQRSGTTLLEKLLGAQPRVSMLSQPFPLLFTETKRAFLGDGDPYPLGHLFLDARSDSGAFARFLHNWRTSGTKLEALFARMQNFSGQYTRFEVAQLDAAFSAITADDDFAAVVGRLDQSLARKRDAQWFGSKETICEEYVPPLLDRGFHCAIILRDPRDVVASLNHGRGREFGGDLKPTLFNIRSWRKSVAVALAMSAHPHFHFCHYEDLVADPKRELDRFATAFGTGGTVVPDELPSDDGAPWSGNSSHGEHHGIGTTSVAMWRQVLPPEVAALIEAACLPELQVLGYETSITRAEAGRVIERFREPYTITRTGMESDMYSAANAAVEIERLERVSDAQDEQSARWFLCPDAHVRLREGFRP